MTRKVRDNCVEMILIYSDALKVRRRVIFSSSALTIIDVVINDSDLQLSAEIVRLVCHPNRLKKISAKDRTACFALKKRKVFTTLGEAQCLYLEAISKANSHSLYRTRIHL